jgi:hypothetical protein
MSGNIIKKAKPKRITSRTDGVFRVGPDFEVSGKTCVICGTKNPPERTNCTLCYAPFEVKMENREQNVKVKKEIDFEAMAKTYLFCAILLFPFVGIAFSAFLGGFQLPSVFFVSCVLALLLLAFMLEFGGKSENYADNLEISVKEFCEEKFAFIPVLLAPFFELLKGLLAIRFRRI